MKKLMIIVVFFAIKAVNAQHLSPRKSAGYIELSLVNWTNKGNLLIENRFTRVSLSKLDSISMYLFAYDFGFDIPEDAIVTSVTAHIDREANDGRADLVAIKDHEVKLFTGDSLNTSNYTPFIAISDNRKKLAPWAISDSRVQIYDMGVAAASDINNYYFGLGLKVQYHGYVDTTGVYAIAAVYSMSIEVNYELPTGISEAQTRTINLSPEYYTISGAYVGNDKRQLQPGVYLEKIGDKFKKIGVVN